jgi:hypothetical protein
MKALASTGLHIIHPKRTDMDGIDLLFMRFSTMSGSRCAREVGRYTKLFNPRHICIEGLCCMPVDDRNKITDALLAFPRTVSCTPIDAGSFTGHIRKRIYWTSWKVAQPLVNTDIRLAHYLDDSRVTRYKRDDLEYVWPDIEYYPHKINYSNTSRIKAYGITSSWAHGLPSNVLIDSRFHPSLVRKFSPEEIERLLGLPEGWTRTLSQKERYEVLASESDVEVLKFILETLP